MGRKFGLSEDQAALARDVAARGLFLLPHDVRRRVFQRLQPGSYALYQAMRDHDLGVVDGQDVSLKPFDDHKCIFVHIPKCGGISVGQALFGKYEGNHLPMPQNRTNGKRTQYQDVYTPRMRTVVERLFRRDIELFDYTFDG